MEIEGFKVNEYGGFYTVTLGDKTYTRAKLSNLETIINMYSQGGELREKVNTTIPEQREEWLATHTKEELATGKVVDVVTKTPVHPDDEYVHTFELYEYVPEYGKSAEAVRIRGEEVHAAEHAEERPGFPSFHLPHLSLPSFKLPEMSLFGKGVGSILIIFVGTIVVLIALGYSGLGGSAGRVAERKIK